jgi:hypothetical protein
VTLHLRRLVDELGRGLASTRRQDILQSCHR